MSRKIGSPAQLWAGTLALAALAFALWCSGAPASEAGAAPALYMESAT